MKTYKLIGEGTKIRGWEYKPGRYAVTEKNWDRYIERCQDAGTKPINPEDEGIIITANN